MLKRIFVIGSILFLSFMVIFYGYRLFYFYSAEHKKTVVTTLTNQIITNSEKLVEKDNDFYFNGDVSNNYLYYSGMFYRIVSFNDDYLTLIVNEDLTKLKYGVNEDYETSDVKIWLENEYLNNLNQGALYSQEAKLLDLKTYAAIGESNSFINSTDMWIVDGNQGLMLDKVGNVNTPSSYQYFLSIRPVIKIKNINYIKGNGTINNPYVVENKIVNTLEDTYVGEYIKYKNNLYRIISKESGIKVIAIDSIGQHNFSSLNVLYESGTKEDLFSYLNNDFLSKLNQNDLVLTTWNNGKYNTSYQETKSHVVSSYIGLLTVGDYFIQNITGYLLLPSDDMVYTVTEDKNLYMVNPNKVLDIYPSFSLKKDLIVNRGIGTKENPYEVGE